MLNYGVKAKASNSFLTGTNYGIYGEADGAETVNIGVYGLVDGSGDGSNYAIFGDASGLDPSETLNNYAGYFVGNVIRTGTDNFSSDSILKKNINPIQNGLSLLKKLKPHTYEFKTDKYPYLGLESGKQYGLIAQEVEPIIPEFVKNVIHPAKIDSLGNIIRPSLNYKTLNYIEFIPILIQGLKEQQKIIDSLKNKVDSMNTRINNEKTTNDSLKTKVNSQQSMIDTLNSKNLNERLTQLEAIVNQCCNKNQNQEKKLSMQEVELSNGDAIVLDQNVPNPFAESTTISYYIPENIASAQIIFIDNSGRIMKTVNIKEKGKGMLKVYAQDLSSGIYSYTLVADGKTIDSKKMIKMR